MLLQYKLSGLCIIVHWNLSIIHSSNMGQIVSKKKKSVSFQKEFPILKASLVIQMVKNMPTMQETQLQSRVQEDPWRRDWLPTPVFLLGEFHGQRSLVAYSPQGRRVRYNWVTNTLTFTLSPYFETQTLPNFRLQLITESWLLSICLLVS